MSVWITPTMLAGAEDSATNIKTIRCETANEAVAVIQAGHTAWIPTDSWDSIAYDVMIMLGSTSAWTQRAIHFARYGVLLSEADFA